MKYFIPLLVILFCLTNQSRAQNDSLIPLILRLRILTPDSEPIPGVYIINQQQSYLITSSDVDGECSIYTTDLNRTDSIQFQGMGYQTATFCLQDLLHIKHITLQELRFNIEAIQVTILNTDRLLADAMSHLQPINENGKAKYRFHGKSLYEKITESRNATVEYRREYGWHFTSGNIKSDDEWDKEYCSSLIPKYIARTYNLTHGGYDTLQPIFITSKDARFDIGTRKIFTLMRAIQLFAPLFSGTEQYTIHRIDSDDDNYVFSFKTKASHYPDKARLLCNGTFTISVANRRLTSMTFDYVDYQLFRQVILTKQRKINSPFSTKAHLTFKYTDNNECYIDFCTMETQWKHNLGEEFILIEQPSRIHAGVNKLVEKEAFKCEEYNHIAQEYQTQRIFTKIHLAQRFPAGTYDSVIFDNLTPLLDNHKAITEMSSFMDIEQQYHHHNNKEYYPDNYLSDFKGRKENNDTYKAHLHDTREQLFEIFKF